MLRDAFVDQLLKRLKNNTDTTLRDDVITEMAFVQANMLEGDVFKPWFLVSDESTSTTVTGDMRVPLPADFLMPWGAGLLYRYDATLDDPYLEMYRDDWDLIATEYNSSGTPTHWDISGDYILVRPIPDAVYTLKWRYMQRGTDLSGTYGDASNIENVWLKWAADWFMGEVGAIIADQYLSLKDVIVKRFEGQAARGRDRIMRLNVAMEEALKERIIGG